MLTADVRGINLGWCLQITHIDVFHYIFVQFIWAYWLITQHLSVCAVLWNNLDTSDLKWDILAVPVLVIWQILICCPELGGTTQFLEEIVKDEENWPSSLVTLSNLGLEASCLLTSQSFLTTARIFEVDKESNPPPKNVWVFKAVKVNFGSLSSVMV